MIVDLKKRYLYTFAAIFAVVLGVIAVNAFGTNNPQVFGHSAGELEIPAIDALEGKCPAGKAIKGINADGTLDCIAVGSGGSGGIGSGIDFNDCQVVDLDASTSGPIDNPPNANEDWRAQCNDGYAVVGIYERDGSILGFGDPERMKCCKVNGGDGDGSGESIATEVKVWCHGAQGTNKNSNPPTCPSGWTPAGIIEDTTTLQTNFCWNGDSFVATSSNVEAVLCYRQISGVGLTNSVIPDITRIQEIQVSGNDADPPHLYDVNCPSGTILIGVEYDDRDDDHIEKIRCAPLVIQPLVSTQ
jgi:hypothetical protein